MELVTAKIIDNYNPTIQIISNNEPMVIIYCNDMTIEFGNNYNPDEAATIFWNAVGVNGELIKNKISRLEKEVEELKEYKYMYESLG